MIINQSINMASNNNDNNMNNMPDEVKDLIASSIKKDIVAMCNIKCTSKSLSRVNHTTPERWFLSQEIINECTRASPDNICSICAGGIKRPYCGEICRNCHCDACGEHCDLYGCYYGPWHCNAPDMVYHQDIVSLYPIFE